MDDVTAEGPKQTAAEASDDKELTVDELEDVVGGEIHAWTPGGPIDATSMDS